MMISILILLLCLCLALSWVLTLVSSEKTVRIMPVLLVTEGIFSVILLILSAFYQKMIVSVLLTAFFFCYLIYLLFHKEAEYQPDRKLLVFSWEKFGRFFCELKEIYPSPEAFPKKKELHAYRTPDNFIMLRSPDDEREFFAYQFTNYHYLLDGKKRNCLVIGALNPQKMHIAGYHQKRFFAFAEHLLCAGLITFLAVPMLFMSVMRQNSVNLEDFVRYCTETGISAVSESSAESIPHESSLILLINKSAGEVTSAKIIALDESESELDMITLNSRLMTADTAYTMLRDRLNTEDFSQIKTLMQNMFGIQLNHIIAVQTDQILSSGASGTLSFSVTPEQMACLENGISYQESGKYTLQEVSAILQGLEQYLVSDAYDNKILSENELAVMQNEFLPAVMSCALQQTVVPADNKPVRTTMTESEIRKLYDTVMIAESRYKKCFQQKEHSIVLPSADDCIKLDSASLYAPDSVLKYLMVQALYY
ncbi:MAG: hypothetical protein IJJ69_02665 [Oscillospiraceae bacterium]|nr:hypothetical protein [Oscillospiraceae bacterium]